MDASNLENRRLLATGAEVISQTGSIVAAIQGTPVSDNTPNSIVNNQFLAAQFTLNGVFRASDLAATLSYDDGTSAPSKEITVQNSTGLPASEPSSERFLTPDGSGGTIVLNNLTVFHDLTLKEPSLLSKATPSRTSDFIPSGSLNNGLLVANQSAASGLPSVDGFSGSGNPFLVLAAPGPNGGSAGLGTRRGEISLNLGTGVGIPIASSTPGDPELYLFENSTPEFYSVALEGLDSAGNVRKTDYWWRESTVDNVQIGAGRFSLTSIDFQDPLTFGKDPVAQQLVTVNKISIRGVTAGANVTSNPNLDQPLDTLSAATVISRGGTPTPIAGRHVINPLPGDPLTTPVVGASTSVFPKNYKGFTNDGQYRPRYEFSTADLALAVAASGKAQYQNVSIVSVFGSHRYEVGRVYSGVVVLSTASNNLNAQITTQAVGLPNQALAQQGFRVNVSPLLIADATSFIPNPQVGDPLVVPGNQLASTVPPDTGVSAPRPEYYNASVDFGDGTIRTAQVVLGPNGTLRVINPGHVYFSPGARTIRTRLQTINGTLIGESVRPVNVTQAVETTTAVESVARVPGRPTQVILRLNQSLDPVSARDPNNYCVTYAGLDGRYGSIDDVPIAARAVSYQPGSNTVILTLEKPLSLNLPYEFFLHSERLRDARGRLVDGNNDGVAGGSYLKILQPLSRRLVGRQSTPKSSHIR